MTCFTSQGAFLAREVSLVIPHPRLWRGKTITFYHSHGIGQTTHWNGTMLSVSQITQMTTVLRLNAPALDFDPWETHCKALWFVKNKFQAFHFDLIFCFGLWMQLIVGTKNLRKGERSLEILRGEGVRTRFRDCLSLRPAGMLRTPPVSVPAWDCSAML